MIKLIVMLAVAGVLFQVQRYIYGKYWKTGLSVKIDFQDKAVLEGEEARMTEVIENRKLLPLSFLNVKIQISRNLVFSNMENTSVSDFTYKSDVFTALSHQRITRHLVFSCRKRGYYEITSTDIISSDLLMTCELVDHVPQNTWLYVYPRYVDISALDVPYRKMIGSTVTRRFLYEDPFAFRGIRDYTLTDPMNSINWKASARTGDLMVNQYDSTSSQEAVIVLNLSDETVWKYDQLHEMSIRLALAVATRFLSDSIPTRMICNGCDCITNETAVIPPGNGIMQVNAIAEVLSRVDLAKEPVSSVDQMKLLEEEDLGEAPLFVMISNDMSQKLQEEFAVLCDACQSLWICPVYQDMEVRVAPRDDLQIVRWEVSRYEE